MTRRMAAQLCLALAAAPFRAPGADLPASTLHFRLAISENMIGADVNEGDAKLAMEAWRIAVVKQSGLLLDISILPMAKLLRTVQQHQVDAFSTTAPEFRQVEEFASRYLVLDEVSAKGGDEYIVLVHEDSGIRSLAELRHKTVNVFDNPRMSLASMWLDTVLSSANLGPQAEFFGRQASQSKLSRVVLPVYFRQIDACLVSKHGFGTMCELNPQLGRKLKVVADSPKLISGAMAFHKDLAPDHRQQMQTAILGLSKTAAGQQAMVLFESNQLIAADTSLLRPTLDLVKAHEQLHLKVPAKK